MLQETNLNDDAYTALKSAIRDSVFAPLQQLSEGELAVKFGVSRTPVHEAALRLQEEGLLKIHARKGIVISALSPQDVSEIYDVIIAIEAAASQLCAQLPQELRLELCDKLQAATNIMGVNLEEWAEADRQFHLLLVENCGNSRFQKIMQTVNDQSHRARKLTLKLRQDLHYSVAEHEQIINAIRHGLNQIAFETAKMHRIRARNELLPLIAKFGLNNL